jgi:hypothetical protein
MINNDQIRLANRRLRHPHPKRTKNSLPVPYQTHSNKILILPARPSAIFFTIPRAAHGFLALPILISGVDTDPYPVSTLSLDPYPDSQTGSGSGSRRAKMIHKNRKKLRSSFFEAGCFVLRANGFSCSLNVLYRGQGISKLQFLILKKKKFRCIFFLQFLVIKSPDPDCIRIRIHLKCWIRIHNSVPNLG